MNVTSSDEGATDSCSTIKPAAAAAADDDDAARDDLMRTVIKDGACAMKTLIKDLDEKAKRLVRKLLLKKSKKMVFSKNFSSFCFAFLPECDAGRNTERQQVAL